jgi:hypothetical protein
MKVTESKQLPTLVFYSFAQRYFFFERDKKVVVNLITATPTVI